ncbi:MAG TPA: methanogenesis marker 17 protein [Methanoregulaceae archaeon]|jgi:putative methanogenesis marker protein 17|nr:methanogenesis marker 17 protein [Methanoregulaceae archaeon]HQC11940.1 methanogenesis marker 17 protein [Methanoregulaceae archaeon]
MASIEYFEVECPEKTGGRYYQKIADVVLLDHNLIRVIQKIHFFIDPRVPIFVAVGITRKMPGPVRLRDFSDVSVQDDKVTISIGDETYLAKLLESLWDIFGKERVEQPDRFTVVITAGTDETKDLEDLVVDDPSLSIYKDLIYALQVIQPEGFKVRRQYYGDGRFYLVASEDTLPEDIDDLVREKFALLEESP